MNSSTWNTITRGPSDSRKATCQWSLEHHVDDPLDAAKLLETTNTLELGDYLIFGEDEREIVVPLTREWTRIGRSLIADVYLEDTTVSRRHALLGRQPDGVRLLDDHSLNGVFVNGERVEWTMLHHGDEIEIGRYRLHFISPDFDSGWESAGQ